MPENETPIQPIEPVQAMNPDPSPIQPVPGSSFKLTSLEITLSLILAIALVLAWMWAKPAYEKVVKDCEYYKTKYEYATSHTKTVIKKIYVNGQLSSETDETVADTTAGQGSSDGGKNHQATTIKRGLGGFGLGLGTNGLVNVLLRADVIGPIGLAATSDIQFKSQEVFATLSF